MQQPLHCQVSFIHARPRLKDYTPKAANVQQTSARFCQEDIGARNYNST